ncbi:MAG: 6-bladed beta-propeller [Mucilaginibacter sp.]|nr:6-bladed beta-propeller [Mucilaginibacter sp.]
MRLRLASNKLIISFCLLIASGTAVLAQKVIKVDSSHVQTLRVDPGNSVGGVASDFFTEVNYVPLETTKESLFGSISRLEVTDDYYIILDNNTHSILIFTKAGKFHAKIKSTEGSSKSYIYGFSINKWEKLISFTRDYKNLIYCDYDGKQVKTGQIGGATDDDQVNSSEYYFVAPGKAVTPYYYNSLDSTDKSFRAYKRSLILYTGEDHKVYAHGLGFKKEEAHITDEGYFLSGMGPVTKSGVDSILFYSKLYDNAIYTITPNTIKFSYKIILPLYSSLPIDFITNHEYDKKRMEYVEKHQDAVYSICNVFRIGNNLMFKAGSMSNNKEDNLIYNLKSGSLIAYKHIQQDEKSYFLPIYDQANRSFNNSGLLGCSGGYLYTSISSLGMFKAHDESAEQKPKYNPVLTDYFKKGNLKDNPVILQLKLKDQL